MNSNGRNILLGICLTNLACSLAASREGWKGFRSEQYRYSVRYPASWHLLETSLHGKPDSLDILNFPVSQRVEGVILKHGGAEISVGVPAPEVTTIDQWEKAQTKFDEEVTEHELKLTTSSSIGCRRLVEVTSLFEVGPGRKYSKTTYYCRTNQGLYGIFLTNWQGDLQESGLRKVALEIAESLQTTDSKPKSN